MIQTDDRKKVVRSRILDVRRRRDEKDDEEGEE